MMSKMNQKYGGIKSPICLNNDLPICYTCKSFIQDLPYRFLIVKDMVKKHKLLPFHYFFPCWDVNYVCQNLTEYQIFRAGFCCERSIKKTPKVINNFRKNSDLWDI